MSDSGGTERTFIRSGTVTWNSPSVQKRPEAHLWQRRRTIGRKVGRQVGTQVGTTTQLLDTELHQFQ